MYVRSIFYNILDYFFTQFFFLTVPEFMKILPQREAVKDEKIYTFLISDTFTARIGAFSYQQHLNTYMREAVIDLGSGVWQGKTGTCA